MLLKSHIFLVHYLLQAREMEGNWGTVWQFQTHGIFSRLIASWRKGLAKPCIWSQI